MNDKIHKLFYNRYNKTTDIKAKVYGDQMSLNLTVYAQVDYAIMKKARHKNNRKSYELCYFSFPTLKYHTALISIPF